jgi:hypothetical protein
MNTEFDILEQQLSQLRPARLPAPVRHRLLREMEQPLMGHESMSWLLGHRVGFEVALAGALFLALLVGWHWLPRSARPASHLNQTAAVTGDALMPSLAFLEARLAAASIGANTVAVLRSPSILTNTQILR